MWATRQGSFKTKMNKILLIAEIGLGTTQHTVGNSSIREMP